MGGRCVQRATNPCFQRLEAGVLLYSRHHFLRQHQNPGNAPVGNPKHTRAAGTGPDHQRRAGSPHREKPGALPDAGVRQERGGGWGRLHLHLVGPGHGNRTGRKGRHPNGDHREYPRPLRKPQRPACGESALYHPGTQGYGGGRTAAGEGQRREVLGRHHRRLRQRPAGFRQADQRQGDDHSAAVAGQKNTGNLGIPDGADRRNQGALEPWYPAISHHLAELGLHPGLLPRTGHDYRPDSQPDFY